MWTICVVIIEVIGVCEIDNGGWCYESRGLRWVGNRVKIGQKWGIFYGMELPRVGAFTEKWGSGYRNPVQNLA